ncbi:cytochrome c3 family protein [Neobacillus soli]|uniref:cytochrome c3 family protein n=1 Tax=Neobacillus soli TaxID=220688 RepID=UPI0008243DF5|nr:cytochrome c3 family protein [Neobacillus soli]
MKRENFKRKLISYFIILGVILSSILLYSPDNNALSATGVPEIKILTPEADAVLDVSTVEITGRISDDLTAPDKLSVMVFELGDSQQPIDITGEGIFSSSKPLEDHADFSYSKDFSEGVHTLTFVVTDQDGVSNKAELSFTVQQAVTEETNKKNVTTDKEAINQAQSSSSEENPISESSIAELKSSLLDTQEIGNRPYMKAMYLIPKGSEQMYKPNGVYTDDEKVEFDKFRPAEDMTRVPVNYQILVEIRSAEELSAEKQNQPLITAFEEKGQEKFVEKEKLSNGTWSYVYLFTPDQLTSGTTYYVYLNPNFSSGPDKYIIPRFLKFTTSSSAYATYQFKDEDGNNLRGEDNQDYIHGPFSNVTNSCAYCHSTHKGTSPKLEGGKYGPNGNDLCMVCHDGTNGNSSPMVDTHENNKHTKDSSVSCSSCHNPHKPGTKENPNSFHSIPSLDSNGSDHKAYNKASTAKGNADDFSLCLSCHNGIKDESGKETSNIEKYYTDVTHMARSGHNFQATVDSGSKLNGQLPCAECHETHGSNNIKMLREELGNVQSDANKFTKISGDWDTASQRNFCLACHNNKTVLYGKTGKAIYDETGAALNTVNEQTKIGHKSKSENACSECHSNNDSFIEAAHAPKRVKNP